MRPSRCASRPGQGAPNPASAGSRPAKPPSRRSQLRPAATNRMGPMADAPLRSRRAREPAGVAGRPKRTKRTIGDDFTAALRQDFRDHGAGVIAKVRAEKPDQYLKIVLSVLPGPKDPDANTLDTLSDEQIRARIRALEAIVRPFLGDAVPGAADGAGAPPPR
ncbi:hypothetical protein EN738_30385 [Mesorhizobium sp. M4B.F.Ca.ET.017.02.2.1]|nr:hypothetical protein EN738_30385 [Mesorhizobium sp. M4B.F.Ca.ET.017.02.2.1]